jgi:hypothetical protein
MAEREGFEPSKGLTPYALSRGAPSAARPPLLMTRRILTHFFKMPTAMENYFLYFKSLVIFRAISTHQIAEHQLFLSEFVDKSLLCEQIHP